MPKGNQYWSGHGKVWVNDKVWDKVKAFEAKATMEWEDVPNGMQTARVPMGYTVEGSFTIRKSDNSYILDLLAEDYKNGVVTDVKIIAKVFNKATGKTERVAYKGVTFDEIPLSKFEERTVLELELSFKAEDFEILQSI